MSQCLERNASFVLSTTQQILEHNIICNQLFGIKCLLPAEKKRKPTKCFLIIRKILQRELFVVTAAAGAVCCQNLRWQKGREKFQPKKKKKLGNNNNKIQKVKKKKKKLMAYPVSKWFTRTANSAKPKEKPVSLKSRHRCLFFSTWCWK